METSKFVKVLPYSIHEKNKLVVRVNNLQDRFDPDWSIQSIDLLQYAKHFQLISNILPLKSIDFSVKPQ